MTQATAHTHDDLASAQPMILTGQVNIFPLINFPRSDGAAAAPQHSAYDTYVAGFLSRVEQLCVTGCEGVRFDPHPELAADQGYLYIEVSVCIEIPPTEEAFTDHASWEAAAPGEDDWPTEQYVRAERRLEWSLSNLLERRARKAGYIISVRSFAVAGKSTMGMDG